MRGVTRLDFVKKKKKKSYPKMKWYSLCVQHYSVCSAYFQRFYFLDKNGKLHSYYYIFYYIHISIEYRYLHNYITCPKLQNTYVSNFFCWNYWRCSIFLLVYLGSRYNSFVCNPLLQIRGAHKEHLLTQYRKVGIS